MKDSTDYEVNYPSTIENNNTDITDNSNNTENPNSENTNTENIVDITEFSKILIDFLNDLLLTFPEIREKLTNDLKIIYNREKETSDDIETALKNIYEYCQKFYPERFFDILYQNNEIFSDLSINTYFLPNINFSELWQLDISDTIKKTIWKYIQLILFTVITNVKSDNSFGNTAKLFEAIGEDEFKNKITETMEEMQEVLKNSTNDMSGINVDNLPNPNEIHDHINNLMDGKLGNLAKEIANDTAANLDIDPENINNVGDVFQKLFKDPGKLMGIVKNVGSKLDEKMKSGELKESELIQEATDMMHKMQNLPGMDKMGDILNKLNLPNLGGNGKFNKNAFESIMNTNLKKAKTKERMRTKLDEKKNITENDNKNNSKSELESVNANLMEIMKQLNLDNIPDLMQQMNSQQNLNLDSNTPRNKKKKNKGGKKK